MWSKKNDRIAELVCNVQSRVTILLVEQSKEAIGLFKNPQRE